MQKGQVGSDLNRASGYFLLPKHRRQLWHGRQIRISRTDEDKPKGNSILRAGAQLFCQDSTMCAQTPKLPMMRRRCRGNVKHSVGVSRVATLVAAHSLSPTFGSATTRRSSPGGAVRPHSSSSTNALLQERGTSHPARSEPGPPSHQRSRLLPRSEQRGLRPQRCTKEHFFFSTPASSPKSSCDLSILPAGATAHCAIPRRPSTTTPTTRPR